MAIAELLLHDVSEYDLSRIQDNINDWTQQVSGREILDGQIVADQVLAIGDNTINHSLGRDLQGWFVIMRSAATALYDKQGANGTPELTLVLNSSAVATVSIWVF